MRPEPSDDEVRSLAWHMRDKMRIEARIRQVTRSADAMKQALAAEAAEHRIAINQFYATYGDYQTIYGSVSRPTGHYQTVDMDVVLNWAREHRPGVIRESVPTSALLESGAKWVKNTVVFVDSGEIVPGIGRTTVEAPTISHAKTDLGDDDADFNEN